MPATSSLPLQMKAGFALPTVLTVVTILTLIFMTCILALHDLYGQTEAALLASEFERAAATAEARFMYLATTEPLGPDSLRIGSERDPSRFQIQPTTSASAGVSLFNLKLDGRPYAWTESSDVARSYQVSVQDTAGLVNVDSEPPITLQRLFTQFGADEALSAHLADELLDYMDEDDLARLNGAEAEAYRATHRPPPPNRKLRHVGELGGLLSWPRLSSGQRHAIAAAVTTQPDINTVNINTASVDALQILLGVTRQQAQQAVADRERTPLVTPRQLGVSNFDDERVYTFPNGRFRFRFIDPKNGLSYSSEISLTPGHQDRPVWVQDQLSQHTDRHGPEANTELIAFPKVGQAAER